MTGNDLTPVALAFVALAGGLGAVSRYGLDHFVNALLRGRSLGIFAVNVSASLLMGVLAGLGIAGVAEVQPVDGALVSPAAALTVVSGLLGGFSTFSTVAVDAAMQGLQRRWGGFLLTTVGMFAVSFAAFAAAHAAASAYWA